MKRKIVWLALPLILGALMLGAKWRAEHPTPTKEDLEIRALIANPRIAYISYDSSFTPTSAPINYRSSVFNYELTSLTDYFYLLPKSPSGQIPTFGSETLHLTWYFSNPKKDAVKRIYISLFDKTRGQCVISNSRRRLEYTLHPVTVKRWIELLLANPRIGPELRARMK